MATFERHVDVDWQGSVMEGKGEAKAGTGAFSLPVTFPARIGEPGGKTSPEELMAAAHAACYAMALNGTLGPQGRVGRSHASSRATVTADKGDAGIKIMSSKLEVTAYGLKGLDAAQFAEIAKEAEGRCPVSNAYRGTMQITVDAKVVWRTGGAAAGSNAFQSPPIQLISVDATWAVTSGGWPLHSPRRLIAGDTNAIHVSPAPATYLPWSLPVGGVRPRPWSVVMSMCVRPRYVGLRLQPRPQLLQILVAAREGFEHAIVAAVVRPVVGFAERQIQHARPVPREMVHREPEGVGVVTARRSTASASRTAARSGGGCPRPAIECRVAGVDRQRPCRVLDDRAEMRPRGEHRDLLGRQRQPPLQEFEHGRVRIAHRIVALDRVVVRAADAAFPSSPGTRRHARW